MFKKIFGRDENEPEHKEFTMFKLLNDYVPAFFNYRGKSYDDETVRACIHAIANNAAKLKARHIRRVDGKIINTNSRLEKLLQIRPNEYMNAYDFVYKLVSLLYTSNNAFVYIKIVNGEIVGLYPINFSNAEIKSYKGEMYVSFHFYTGFKMTVPYIDLIHLRRHFNRDDFWGEDNEKPIKGTLNVLYTIAQGIVNSIRQSGRLRGLLKYTSNMRPEDLKAAQEKFVKDYLNVNNDGGVAALDTKAEYIPIDMKIQTADDKQTGIARESVYRYYNISEKIVQSRYNETEWNAFYESVIEPIAIQLSLECTAKLFTEREKGHGNEIIFESNRLQYAAASTKISLISKLMPLGIFTVNEAREVFNLVPVDGGDKRQVSLNYVNANKQDKYQIGEDDEKNIQDEKGEQDEE